MSSNRQLLTEFRPALRFLVVFVAVYLVGNIFYGIWIERCKPLPDPMTVLATRQTVSLLQLLSEPVTYSLSQTEPIVKVIYEDRLVLRVFEGCNGINVMIVFAAFLFAIGAQWKRVVPFMLAGLVVIHAANLGRIALLYYTASYRPLYFYYFHKYLFTAVLYLVVFAMWYIWLGRTAIKTEEFVTVKKQNE